MVRDICEDLTFLAQKAEPATVDDLSVAEDLLDTLALYRGDCFGMAANMIGVNKRIIVFEQGEGYGVMFNPEITHRSGPYEAEEECLSIPGFHPAKRWHSIEVCYQDAQFRTLRQTFTGWTAQIIQHEIDHCEGILV